MNIYSSQHNTQIPLGSWFEYIFVSIALGQYTEEYIFAIFFIQLDSNLVE